jgi:hypothetical protein
MVLNGPQARDLLRGGIRHLVGALLAAIWTAVVLEFMQIDMPAEMRYSSDVYLATFTAAFVVLMYPAVWQRSLLAASDRPEAGNRALAATSIQWVVAALDVALAAAFILVVAGLLWA